MGKKFDVLVRKQVHHFIIRAPHRLTELTLLPGRMQEEILNLVANDFLRQLDFFKGLDKDNHAKLAHLLKPCRFDPEAVVFRAKSIATEMYFVVSGKVSISVHADNLIWRRENPITFPDESNAELEGVECRESLVSTGGLFGEVELFPAELLEKKLRARFGTSFSPEYHTFRALTARAKTRCELLELEKEDLEGVIRTDMPDLYDAILTHAVYSAKSYEAIHPQHKREMSERFGRRHLHGQSLVDDIARTEDKEEVRNYGSMFGQGYHSLASDLVHAQAGSLACDFPGHGLTPTFTADADLRAPTAEAEAGDEGGGDSGDELEELRGDIAEVKKLLREVLLALGGDGQRCSEETPSREREGILTTMRLRPDQILV